MKEAIVSIIMFSRNLALLGFLSTTSLSFASSVPIFSDNYSSFQLGSGTVGANAALTCSEIPGGVPANLVNFKFPASVVGKWSMLVSTDYQNHLSWSGAGPTSSWAYSSAANALYFHAALNWPAPSLQYDQGFAFLTNTTFDSNRYLSAQASIAYDTCQQTGSAVSCQVGTTLINSESNYRAVYLAGQSGSASVNVIRYAPCDAQQLVYVDGTPVTAPIAQPVTIRIDYLGSPSEPSPGGWNYFINGRQAFLQSSLPNRFNSAVPAPSESSTYLQAPLIQAAGATRLGTYMTVNGSDQSANLGYVEGRLFNTSLYEFNVVPANNITFTSSNLKSNGNVVSGTIPGLVGWNSGGTAPAWIQLDLHNVESVKKIRLLTAQTPSGNTTHIITGSNSITAAGDLYSPVTLGTISSFSTDNQWLNLEFPAWQGVRYIRISTVQSPSWVAWRQIEVYN